MEMHRPRAMSREVVEETFGKVLVKQQAHCVEARLPGLCLADHQPPFSIGRKGKARADIVALQLRKVGENLLLAHAAGEAGKYVTHYDKGVP